MKIYETIKQYEKQGNKWILIKEYPTKDISPLVYSRLTHEKQTGDRRTFQYSYEFGQRLMTRLTNTNPILGLKSVRTFEFEREV